MAVRPSKPRRTARITFADGRVFSAPVGTRLGDYVAAATKGEDLPTAIAAVVDGKLTELNRHVSQDGYAMTV